MAKNDTITVYWAPSKFTTEAQSWNMLYRNPRSILSSIHLNNKPKGNMGKCPAVRDTFKNVYSFDSAIYDSFELSPDLMKQIAYTDSEREFIPSESKLYIEKARKSSIEDYININYNMGWVFFASEPLIAKMTAPYFPPVGPAKNAFLAAGQFDIGRWLRPFVLDYHIPLSTNLFKIEESQPLFFLELLTDKKIIFKRFELTPRLDGYINEAVGAPSAYQKKQSLLKRYQMAHSAGVPKMILNEIRKNLVD
jgi:hypothetical protein